MPSPAQVGRRDDGDDALLLGGDGGFAAVGGKMLQIRGALMDAGVDEIRQRFLSFSDVASRLRGSSFDPREHYTVVPDFMRHAITI